MYVLFNNMNSANSNYVELYLDTRDGYVTNTNIPKTDWATFNFSVVLENISTLKIIQAEIPFSFYTINSLNNTFTLTDTSGTFIITLPVGNYNPITIIPALITALNDSASTKVYDVDYSIINGHFTITQPTASTIFSIDFNNDLANFFGYLEGVNLAILNGGIYDLTSINVASITGQNYLYMNSTTLGPYTNSYLPFNYVTNTGNNSVQIAKIPINCDPGGIIYYTDPTPQYFFDVQNINQLSTIDFYLSLTPRGVPLNLNGLPFSLKVGLLLKKAINSDQAPRSSGFISS